MQENTNRKERHWYLPKEHHREVLTYWWKSVLEEDKYISTGKELNNFSATHDCKGPFSGFHPTNFSLSSDSKGDH